MHRLKSNDHMKIMIFLGIIPGVLIILHLRSSEITNKGESLPYLNCGCTIFTFQPWDIPKTIYTAIGVMNYYAIRYPFPTNAAPQINRYSVVISMTTFQMSSIPSLYQFRPLQLDQTMLLPQIWIPLIFPVVQLYVESSIQTFFFVFLPKKRRLRVRFLLFLLTKYLKDIDRKIVVFVKFFFFFLSGHEESAKEACTVSRHGWPYNLNPFKQGSVVVYPPHPPYFLTL